MFTRISRLGDFPFKRTTQLCFNYYVDLAFYYLTIIILN